MQIRVYGSFVFTNNNDNCADNEIFLFYMMYQNRGLNGMKKDVKNG